MPLPDRLKIALVDRFCPILCIDPDEPSYPVSPMDYVRQAALWASTPPDHPRLEWGRPGAVGREPLIAHGGIVPDASGNVTGLVDREGERERERWLDRRGWQEGPEVVPSSVNRRALIDGDALEQPWYVCDVWTLADLAESIGPEQLAARFGLGPEDRPAQFERVAVLSFGFLFPGHRQPRRRTLLDPAEDPWSGDYEGDWCHFSVVARCEGDPEGAEAGDFVPLAGAFGQRFRGTQADRDDHATARALLRPWSSLIRVGDHPVVVASAGIHNLHPHDPPLNPGGGIDLQWIDFGKVVSEPANDFVQKAVEQPAASLFSAKVLAGAAAGGFLGGVVGAVVGAVVGGIAAAAEAAEGEKDGLYEVPKLGEEAPPPPTPGEDPFSEDAADLAKDKVAKSALAANPPFFDTAHGESRDWACTPDQALADGAQIVAIQAGLLRGHGRWGVRCDGDGFQVRSGLRLPAYRFHVVDALLRQA